MMCLLPDARETQAAALQGAATTRSERSSIRELHAGTPPRRAVVGVVLSISPFFSNSRTFAH